MCEDGSGVLPVSRKGAWPMRKRITSGTAGLPTESTTGFEAVDMAPDFGAGVLSPEERLSGVWAVKKYQLLRAEPSGMD